MKLEGWKGCFRCFELGDVSKDLAQFPLQGALVTLGAALQGTEYIVRNIADVDGVHSKMIAVANC